MPKWRDVLFFFITKFLPVVASIFPIYVIVATSILLDNLRALIILYTAINLPLAIWMMRSSSRGPARADRGGRDRWRSLQRAVRSDPAARGAGYRGDGVDLRIFAWNEFFFAVNLTAVQAQTMPVSRSGSSPVRALLASSCAAATMAALPVVLAGWVAQNKLVRGLSLGAIK